MFLFFFYVPVMFFTGSIENLAVITCEILDTEWTETEASNETGDKRIIWNWMELFETELSKFSLFSGLVWRSPQRLSKRNSAPPNPGRPYWFLKSNFWLFFD